MADVGLVHSCISPLEAAPSYCECSLGVILAHLHPAGTWKVIYEQQEEETPFRAQESAGCTAAS